MMLTGDEGFPMKTNNMGQHVHNTESYSINKLPGILIFLRTYLHDYKKFSFFVAAPAEDGNPHNSSVYLDEIQQTSSSSKRFRFVP